LYWLKGGRKNDHNGLHVSYSSLHMEHKKYQKVNNSF
jgi:hypothetical protein